jgi:hypothetical protein
MRHLGLDLSLTAAGIVVYDPTAGEAASDRVLHQEVAGHKLSKDDPESVHLARMLSIATKICRVAREFEVDTVTIEGPAYNQKGQLFHLGGLHFIVKSQLRLARKLDSVTVAATSARKRVLGSGRPGGSYKGSPKEWVAYKLHRIHGVDLGDDNLNDALVLCLHAHSIASEDQEAG